MTVLGFPLKVAITIRSLIFYTDKRTGRSLELMAMPTPWIAAPWLLRLAEAVNSVDEPRLRATISGSVGLWTNLCSWIQVMSMDCEWRSLLSSTMDESVCSVLQFNDATLNIFEGFERPFLRLRTSEFLRRLGLRIVSSLVTFATGSDRFNGWESRALTLVLLVDFVILFLMAMIKVSGSPHLFTWYGSHLLGQCAFPFSSEDDLSRSHVVSVPKHRSVDDCHRNYALPVTNSWVS